MHCGSTLVALVILNVDVDDDVVGEVVGDVVGGSQTPQ
jgi:hypothetical protein